MSWASYDTDEKIAAIRDAYEPGMSAAEIAAKIGGVSRNAIIGMYDRHRDKLKNTPLKGARWFGPRAYSKARVAKKAPRRKATRTATVVRLKCDPLPVAPIPPPDALYLTMAELRPNQCRFAVNDAERGQEHLFCGAPADGSWCSHHRQLVYRPNVKMNTNGLDLAA